MEYKFKIGDTVKVVLAGSGIGDKDLDKIVTITDLGKYFSNPGYKIDPKLGNSLNGNYGGFIDEKSFELVKSNTEDPYKDLVGKKIKILDTRHRHDLKIGDILTVKHVDGGYITFIENDVYWANNPTDWELVLETATQEFKKGDIVVSLIDQKANNGDYDSNPIKKGFIGKPLYGGKVIWFYDDGKGSYDAKNFRLATSAEIKQFEKHGNHDLKLDVIDEFKAGDYIVTLNVKGGSQCAKNNFCFKIKINSKYIHPVLDLVGSSTNGNISMRFDKSDNLKDWRYATQDEIKVYDHLGTPYDVTTLKAKSKALYQPSAKYKVGDIVDVKESENAWVYSHPHADIQDIINCNCKPLNKNNCEIVEVVWSKENNQWWYKDNSYGNYLNEVSIVGLSTIKAKPSTKKSNSDIEILAGQTYYAEYSNGGCCIIRPNENGKKSGPGISFEGKSFYNFNAWSADKNIRLATLSELVWLDQCIIAGKYIDKYSTAIERTDQIRDDEPKYHPKNFYQYPFIPDNSFQTHCSKSSLSHQQPVISTLRKKKNKLIVL